MLTIDQAWSYSTRTVRHMARLANRGVKVLAFAKSFTVDIVGVLAGLVKLYHRFGKCFAELCRHLERRAIEHMTEGDHVSGGAHYSRIRRNSKCKCSAN